MQNKTRSSSEEIFEKNASMNNRIQLDVPAFTMTECLRGCITVARKTHLISNYEINSVIKFRSTFLPI